MNNSKPIQVIIPTITKDYIRMRDLVPARVLNNLCVNELIFIGNKELCSIVNDDISNVYRGMPVRVLNEEELLPREPVIECIRERVSSIDEGLASKVRGGWYYQQFLKMIFCYKCTGQFYMSWDMDTVPLRSIELFDQDEKPIFGLKSEYNPGYFKTIDTLLGLGKNIEGSFISEHMVFNRAYMEELIEYINNSPIKGDSFWEKIIGSIDDDYISLGFSEFETYGTFVTDRYPDSYSRNEFRSFRRGSWFVNEKDLDDDDIIWLAKDYDAITFENAEQIQDMVQLFRNPKYRNNMSARKFYETILESGYFGEYSEGRINAGDWYAPV